jgi:hypothetical protein
MTELTSDQLAGVIGGYDDSFGRCGPGNDWKWMGDVRTPECAAHDKAVRDAKASGASTIEAQARALPLLPAAAASWVKAKLG